PGSTDGGERPGRGAADDVPRPLLRPPRGGRARGGDLPGEGQGAHRRPAAASAGGVMALAEVARFATLSEAHVLVAALRSGGIPAEVFDGELGQMDWPLQQALGGFRVFVPEETAA